MSNQKADIIVKVLDNIKKVNSKLYSQQFSYYYHGSLSQYVEDKIHSFIVNTSKISAF